MPTDPGKGIDTATLPWEELFFEPIGSPIFIKSLLKDPDTGMEVTLLGYPAGVLNPKHTHPCAHGMYVLQGTLVTHKGHFGPGSFVWFPEGEVMEHGATSAQDVVALFLTNKPFSVDYK